MYQSMIIFCRNAFVAIYNLDAANKHVTLRQTISVKNPPWDLTFDDEGRLWVISPCEEEPLQVFGVQGSEVRNFVSFFLRTVTSDYETGLEKSERFFVRETLPRDGESFC